LGETKALHESAVGLAVLGSEHGFERQIRARFGTKHSRRPHGRIRGRARRSQNFLSEASSLAPETRHAYRTWGGPLSRLKTIEVAGAPHDWS